MIKFPSLNTLKNPRLGSLLFKFLMIEGSINLYTNLNIPVSRHFFSRLYACASRDCSISV